MCTYVRMCAKYDDIILACMLAGHIHSASLRDNFVYNSTADMADRDEILANFQVRLGKDFLYDSM